MNRVLTAVTVVALLSTLSPAHADITVDVGRGPVPVRVPTTYDPAQPAPLILVLHGYTSSGSAMENWFQLDNLSEQNGFVFCAPDGTQDVFGLRFWNATDACCDFFNSNVDDSQYLLDLIDAIKAQLNIAERRVHILGHSNGGFMAYRMACDHADVIASIASLAGATFLNPNACQPSEPLHVLQIHGTADAVIPYNGGSTTMGTFPGAVESCERWATYDGCTLVQDNNFPPMDLILDVAGSETTVTQWYDQCLQNGSAELWTMNGGPHSPTLSANMSPSIVDWFLAHPKGGFFVDLGNALAGAYGLPALNASGTLIGGETLSLDATNFKENRPAFLVVGFSDWSIPFQGGVLVPALDFLWPGLFTDNAGEIHLAGTWPRGVPAEFATYYQFWVIDPAGVSGYAATNALMGVTP